MDWEASVEKVVIEIKESGREIDCFICEREGGVILRSTAGQS